jgi:hypothetical protein
MRDSNASVAAAMLIAARTVRASDVDLGGGGVVDGEAGRRNTMSDSVVVCSAYSTVTPLFLESNGTLEWLTLDGSVAPAS